MNRPSQEHSAMPTLILSPRYSDDSITLRRAAITLGWDVMRLASWRPPEDFEPEEPVLFGEPLFNTVVAEQLGLAVVEPPEDFLVRLPEAYVRRRVRLTTAAEARTLPGPLFLKPPNRKTFPARVYGSGSDLPEMPEDDPVLASEPGPVGRRVPLLRPGPASPGVVAVLAQSLSHKGCQAATGLGYRNSGSPSEGSRRWSINRIIASLMNDSDDRTLFSRSTLSRRHRPSQANVRSTVHRIGSFTQPRLPSGRRMTSRPHFTCSSTHS